MNKHLKTYKILMIFLLLLFVVPLNRLNAQNNINGVKQAQQYEEQLLMNLGANHYNFNNEENNSVSLPNNFQWSEAFIDNKRAEYEISKNENYIELYMNGTLNNATAVQRQGKGNIMDLGINGNMNQGEYLQEGSQNYIYDRINGDGLSHTIFQYGDGLGIYNEGMQTLPMIINQRGQNMKLKITGPPN